MDREITSEYALRALPEAEMGKTRVYNGIDIPIANTSEFLTHRCRARHRKAFPQWLYSRLRTRRRER